MGKTDYFKLWIEHLECCLECSSSRGFRSLLQACPEGTRLVEMDMKSRGHLTITGKRKWDHPYLGKFDGWAFVCKCGLVQDGFNTEHGAIRHAQNHALNAA